jgi:hypothetical protein
MLDYVGMAVVALLVVPPVILTAGGALLALAALLPGPRRMRETFRCPFRARTVTVDFLVTEGAPGPESVGACTAFADPTHVTCRQGCRALADVRWGLSRAVFPRWSLTAGGPVTWREAEAPAAPR